MPQIQFTHLLAPFYTAPGCDKSAQKLSSGEIERKKLASAHSGQRQQRPSEIRSARFSRPSGQNKLEKRIIWHGKWKEKCDLSWKLTLGQGVEGDGGAESAAAQTDEVGRVRVLHLERASRLTHLEAAGAERGRRGRREREARHCRRRHHSSSTCVGANTKTAGLVIFVFFTLSAFLLVDWFTSANYGTGQLCII